MDVYLIMRIIITIKDKKNVDSTVDKVLDIGSMLEKKFKGFKVGSILFLTANKKRLMEKLKGGIDFKFDFEGLR